MAIPCVDLGLAAHEPPTRFPITFVSEDTNDNAADKWPGGKLDQFLSALFLPEELIELRFIESWLSQGKKRSRVVRAAQWLHRADVIATHAGLTAFAKRMRANVYFGVCPRPRHGDADDGSIKTVRCVWCDIDEVCLDEARKRWTDAGIPQPSIVVEQRFGNPRVLAA